MPAVGAAISGFLAATPAALGGMSVGTALAIASTAGSLVYSQVQAAQQRKAIEALQARSRGWGVSSREPMAVTRVIYGTQRVGGTIVDIRSSSPASVTFPIEFVTVDTRNLTYLRHVLPVKGKPFRKRHGRRLVDAIHEAGHVVFAKLSGHRVHWVSTEREILRECLGGDINAATAHSDAHLPPGRDRHMARLIVCVAGRVVENWLTGTRLGGFPESDADEAARLAKAITGSDGLWLPLIDAACTRVLECLGDPLVAEAVTAYADAIMRKDPLEEPEIDAIWADLLSRHNRPTSLPSSHV